jgi:methionyl aminopeptidase
MKEELRKAGRVVRGALQLAKKLIDEEVSYLEVANKLEQYIIDKGCFPAFPVNISVNEVAAHYIPDLNDTSKFKRGDVVKVDVGAHYEGWIVDAAITIEVNDNKYKELIEASKNALEAVRNVIHKGISISNLGSVIENEIKKLGFSPIYNLCGHKIERYVLHAGLNIPNYNTGSNIRLDEGIYAVEPFATNGEGFVKNSKPSKCYLITETKVRNPKLQKFMNELYSKYKTLPFAKKWVVKDFGSRYNVDLYLLMLKQAGCLYEFPVLVEKSGGIVSQWETTFYVGSDVYDLLRE